MLFVDTPLAQVARMTEYRSLGLATGLIALVTLFGVGCRHDPGSRAEEYRTYASPDGRFKMVVYRIPTASAMPGQTGDAPGFVRLYEQKTGRVLYQKDVEMVQNIDQVEWSSTNLFIKLFADWRLPKKGSGHV
jgi:hypothetical protein